MDCTIRTERMVLRAMTREDFPFVASLHRRAESYAHDADGPPDESEVLERCEWFLKGARSLPDEGAIRWIAWLGGARIGEITAVCNWEKTLEWELGYHLLAEYWGKGYAAEGVRAAVRFAFEHFRVHRLAAFINAENARSIRLAERVGMRLDGRMRDVRLVGGAYRDECVYSLLATDPRAD